MKRVLWAGIVLLSLTTGSYAVTNDTNASTGVVKTEKKTLTATRGDVTVIEATENLRFLSQKIVKEYLFMFTSPYKEKVKNELKGLLVELSRNLNTIAQTTNDTDTKDILEFLAYSKDQIAQILTEPLKSENAALMLDYSETLLEGADSIATMHAYDFNAEEKMLMTTKQMQYLLERMMKYYMALHTGFDNTTNRKQMDEAIAAFAENLQKIEAYRYPDKLQKVKISLMEGWHVNDSFFKKSQKLFIPKLMLLSTAYIEDDMMQIALYHNRNQ